METLVQLYLDKHQKYFTTFDILIYPGQPPPQLSKQFPSRWLITKLQSTIPTNISESSADSSSPPPTAEPGVLKSVRVDALVCPAPRSPSLPISRTLVYISLTHVNQYVGRPQNNKVQPQTSYDLHSVTDPCVQACFGSVPLHCNRPVIGARSRRMYPSYTLIPISSSRANSNQRLW